MNYFSSLPMNLSLKPSCLPGGGYEIWSVEAIPYGTRYGPCEGVFIETGEHLKRCFQWQVEKNGCNGRKSNWLQFINYTSNEEQQNMIAVQHKSRVYYLTSKNIPGNTELLVLYLDGIVEDKDQITDYNRNDIPKTENTKEDMLKICQNSIFGNKELYIRNKEESKYTTSMADVYYRTFLRNGKKAKLFNLDAIQAMFLCNRHYVPVTKRKNIITYMEKFIQSKDEKCKNFERTNLNTNRKSDLSECKNISEKAYTTIFCRNIFTSCTKLKSYESIHNYGKHYEQNLETNELTYCKRFDNTLSPVQFETNICNSINNKKKCAELGMYQGIVLDMYQVNCAKKRFANKSEFILPDRKDIDKKLYECPVCQKKFAQSNNFKVHTKIHTGEKSYECNICQKKFTRSNYLKVHARVHTNERPYECNICQKKFNHSTNLKRHNKIHVDEKCYECNICQKKFTQMIRLKSHKRIHSGEKPFECSICQKKFTQSNYLKRHKRIHNVEKPYECNICQKKFTQNHYLKVHTRIHTDEKPYGCNVCEKKFTRSTSLERHKKIHNSEKPYQCTTCQKKFTQICYLMEHKKIHSDEEKTFNGINDLKTYAGVHTGEILNEYNTCGKNLQLYVN